MSCRLRGLLHRSVDFFAHPRHAARQASVRCVQLTPDNLCRLFHHPDRPLVCVRLRPNEEMCGQTADQVLAWLFALKHATRGCPASPIMLEFVFDRTPVDLIPAVIASDWLL